MNSYRSAREDKKSSRDPARIRIPPTFDEQIHHARLIPDGQLFRRRKKKVAHRGAVAEDPVPLRDQRREEASEKSWEWQQDELGDLDVDGQRGHGPGPGGTAVVRSANENQ